MLGLGLAFEKISQNIPWNYLFSETIRKRAIRYLLHRYVGQFLMENLSLDQLTIDISSGTGIIKDLALDVQSLNDVAEQLNLPFKFLGGYIGEIFVNIPWRNLLNENCFVGISGLKLILHPKQMDSEISLVDSMIESMTTSMQLAQECLNQVSGGDGSESNFDEVDGNLIEVETNSIDAVENFAQAIDTILNKIKIRFTDTLIKLQYETHEAYSGIGLEVKIDKIDYFDEAGIEKDHSEATFIESSSFTCKKFLIEGISFFTHEYLTKNNWKSRDFSGEKKFYMNAQCKEACDIELDNDSNYESVNDLFQSDNLVLIGKLFNRQEIKLRLKKNETVSGPKIEFQAHCGTLILFLSPRQVHLLLELFEGITAPENDKSYPEEESKNVSQKPMNQSDFHKLERELIQHVSPSNAYSNEALNLQDCWSSPCDMSDNEKFLPLSSGKEKVSSKKENALTCSGTTEISDMNKSFTSTTSASDFDRKTENIINCFRVRFAALGVIIIHENILLPSTNNSEIFMPMSLLEMQKESNNFFSKFGNFTNANNCYDQYLEVIKRFDIACNHNHLRLIGTSINIDENEKIFSKKWEMIVHVNVGWFELSEFLYSPEIPTVLQSKILSFTESSSTKFASLYVPTEPKIKISINSCHNIKSKEKLYRITNPKLELQLCFDDCELEVDVSIVDRINTLLNKQNIIIANEKNISFDKLPSSHLDNQAFFREVINDIKSKPETEVFVHLKCSNINVRLCFPIPDLRPLSDLSRTPWWKRNIRNEMLIFRMNNLQLKSTYGKLHVVSYEVLCNDLHILFQEKENSELMSLLRASNPPDIEEGFNPIRILFQCFPTNESSWLEDEPPSINPNMAKSMYGFLEDIEENPANLFNRRKVASHQHNIINELVIPADQNEISKFIDDTLTNVQYNLDISLPKVQLILPSKYIYERIYNRLVSDLLLWAPSAPTKDKVCTLHPFNTDGFHCISDNTSRINTSYIQPFKAIPSSKYDDLENDEKQFSYQSINDHLSNMKSDHSTNDYLRNKQTLIALKFKINNAVGAIHTPYKNSENKVIPGKHGNVSFTFENGFIFIVSGYKGNVDSCQGIVSLDKLNIYHRSENVSGLSPVLLNDKYDLLKKDLRAVLYPSDNIFGIGGGKNSFHTKDSVTICFKTIFDPVKNEKNIELTGNIFGLTLRYYMASSNEDWMSQIGDFFNVEDYPIEGYTWPDVLTELNIHFDHCSIDYRPLNLSLKSYIVIDSLAILSNLTIKGQSSVLLLIIEDAALFLSQNLINKKVRLKDDYVCVADLGVFELCIKLQKDSVEFPLQELLFSNNIFHIRTCSDSFKALLELLIYLANEGDLIHDVGNSENVCLNDTNDTSKSEHITTNDVICKKEKNNCYDYVENLMQEAMIESDLKDKSPECSNSKEDAEIFLFPDEGSSELKQPTFHSRFRTCSGGSMESALKEAIEEEPHHKSPEKEKKEMDDEFCVLDDVPGTGIKSPSGRPKARHLKIDFITIKDSHFDHIDINSLETHVSTPKHFPKPNLKYNLQEITLVWHMYGGSDFSDSSKSHSVRKKQLTNLEKLPTSLKSDVGRKVSESSTVTFVSGEATIVPDPSFTDSSSLLQQRTNAKWFTIGGPNRCHDVLIEIQLSKIRFNYEIYPSSSPYESHHFLTINDIEIRDRLASSGINKFLYQFCSESLPKQASSNMIQVRAITRRNDPASNSSETSLNIAVRPVRLNVDQDTLIFLNEFVQHILEYEKDIEYGEEEKANTLPHSPVLTVNYSKFDGIDDSNDQDTSMTNPSSSEELECSSQFPIYFRNVVFSPDVPIRIDYHGKHVDMNSQYGALAGLIIGLGQLNHSEITLKRVELKSGVLGIEKLLNSLMNEWIYDIKKNQLPSILGGVGPMHSFVRLFQGIKDFFWLPIEQYHKDGRVIRGLQRGTSAFTTSSAYAVLDLTGRFVECIQSAAETMYDVVSSGPSVRSRPYRIKKGQPKDIREGVATAYGIVRSGLGDTASNIIKVASEEHSHKGVSGAVGGVLRQIPPSVVQPIILASEATCTVIGGMTNQLVPDARKEAVDKWKS